MDCLTCSLRFSSESKAAQPVLLSVQELTLQSSPSISANLYPYSPLLQYVRVSNVPILPREYPRCDTMFVCSVCVGEVCARCLCGRCGCEVEGLESDEPTIGAGVALNVWNK